MLLFAFGTWRGIAIVVAIACFLIWWGPRLMTAHALLAFLALPAVLLLYAPLRAIAEHIRWRRETRAMREWRGHQQALERAEGR